MPASLQLQRGPSQYKHVPQARAHQDVVKKNSNNEEYNYDCCAAAVDGPAVPEYVARHHTRALKPNQCCSAVVRLIDAPVAAVWSVVRRFDNPQAYKHFLKSCHVICGDGDVGTLREVHVVSGLPAGTSTERLEILDDERHVISFSVVGGDHRLHNYRSVTTLHPATAEVGAAAGTVVVESYVVDIPPGNTKEDTCSFVDTIVRCNLQSLAQIAENMATAPVATCRENDINPSS